MSFTATDIDGVWIFTPSVFKDARGFFYESYNKALFRKNGFVFDFVQDNQSFSIRNVIRGLHFQDGIYGQTKLVRVVQGKILDIAVDIRVKSPTFLKYVAVELSDENRQQLLIPSDCAHGFSVLSETAIVAYKCDNGYYPQAERGIRFDDPTLQIDWKIPVSQAMVSDKDRLLPYVKKIFF